MHLLKRLAHIFRPSAQRALPAGQAQLPVALVLKDGARDLHQPQSRLALPSAIPSLDLLHTSIFPNGTLYLPHPRGTEMRNHVYFLRATNNGYDLLHKLENTWTNSQIKTGLTDIEALRTLIMAEMQQQALSYKITDFRLASIKKLPARDIGGTKSKERFFILNFLRAHTDLYDRLDSQSDIEAAVSKKKSEFLTPLIRSKQKLTP